MKLEYKLTIDDNTLKEAFDSYESLRYFIDYMSNQICDIAQFDIIRGAIYEGIDISKAKEK